MKCFVTSPNLPHECAELLIGRKYSSLLTEPLKKTGINAIPVLHNPVLSSTVSDHADLSLIHLGGSCFALSRSLKGSEVDIYLHERNANVLYTEKENTANYPGDAITNACICGRYLIYSEKTVDPGILSYFRNIDGIVEIGTKQGYTRCSVCIINDYSIITSDKDIFKKAESNGMNALCIEPGNISLDGYDYGFIGGCSFKISNDVVAFTGIISSLPDYNNIRAFMNNIHISYLELTDNPLFDIGSAIPLFEK